MELIQYIESNEEFDDKKICLDYNSNIFMLAKTSILKLKFLDGYYKPIKKYKVIQFIEKDAFIDIIWIDHKIIIYGNNIYLLKESMN